MKEEIVKVLQLFHEERLHERVVDFFEPLIKKQIAEMLQLLPQEYSQELVGQLGSFLSEML